MAFALVNASAVGLASATNALTITFTSSGAGHLLVVCLVAQGEASASTWTYSSGWLEAAHKDDTAAFRNAALGYYQNNPGSLTSVTATLSSNATTISGLVLEFSGAATSSALDKVGTVAGGSGTSNTVTTSATLTANNELGVTAWGWTGTSSKLTQSAGSGWLIAGTDGGTKQDHHVWSDYLLDSGSSSGATLSEIATSGATGGQTGIIATFKAAAAAAQIWQPLRRNVNQAVQQSATW